MFIVIQKILSESEDEILDDLIDTENSSSETEKESDDTNDSGESIMKKEQTCKNQAFSKEYPDWKTWSY